MNTPDRDDEFDQTVRALHRDAVAHVSPAVRRRLQSARAPAATGPLRSRFGWAVASALTAVFVLTVALPLERTASTSTDAIAGAVGEASPTPIEPGPVVTPIEPGAPASIAALEESPDFYLWLASNDAALDGALP